MVTAGGRGGGILNLELCRLRHIFLSVFSVHLENQKFLLEREVFLFSKIDPYNRYTTSRTEILKLPIIS